MRNGIVLTAFLQRPPFALRTLTALRCYGPGALGRRAPEKPEKGLGEARSVEEREGKTAATRMSSRHVDTSRLSVEQCWALDDEDDAAGAKLSDDPQLSAILEEHSLLTSDLTDRPAEALAIDEHCRASIEKAVADIEAASIDAVKLDLRDRLYQQLLGKVSGDEATKLSETNSTRNSELATVTRATC
eukprot:COSAG05_NODE_2891_length_2535_cov_3.156814_2_plen_188_part_00